MDHPNKNAARGAATRQNIVDVSRSLFATDGYAATSIEMILAATGISRGAFYHHFKSKEQIFEAVFIEVEQEITLQVVAQTQQIPDPMEALRTGCMCVIESACDPKLRQIGLIDAPAVLGWEHWRKIEEQFGLGLLRAGLNAAAAARGKHEELPPESARLLLAALIEAALIVARADHREQALSNCRSTIDRILLALLGD